MYRPPFFAVDDVTVLHEAMRARAFATIAAAQDRRVSFAYAPVIVDSGNGPLGGIRFHLARGNPLTQLDQGAHVSISMIGADAYISPDWYRGIVTVPTWNYIAVEGEGVLARQSPEELRELVIASSAQEETKLTPKAPWLIDKVPAERHAALLSGIAGFSVAFKKLQGKFKLSQDKKREDIEGAIAGLEARGDAASVAVAAAMRNQLSEVGT
jgi:transcriptional regulator